MAEEENTTPDWPTVYVEIGPEDRVITMRTCVPNGIEGYDITDGMLDRLRGVLGSVTKH
jgi:hypothetical protein